MASAWYPVYKQNLLAGSSISTTAGTGYDLDNNTATDGAFCALVNIASGTFYTYNAAHTVYDAGGANDVIDARASGPADQRISTPTVVAGTFDGDDLTFTAVTAGPAIGALVIYRHNSGAGTTWPLVLYLDNTSVTGLPVTPNGGNITVTWNVLGISTISDARAKRDIRQIGRARNGLNVYEFRYRGQSQLRHGLIAQEVLEARPEAVVCVDGLLAVDYARALAA